MEVSWLHLVPLLPLIGAAVCGLVGKWLPKGWLYAVALASVLLSSWSAARLSRAGRRSAALP